MHAMPQQGQAGHGHRQMHVDSCKCEEQNTTASNESSRVLQRSKALGGRALSGDTESEELSRGEATHPLASGRLGSSLGKKPGSLRAVSPRKTMARTSSTAITATRAHEMFGPTLGATNPNHTPHGARMMRIVPSRLFQSVPERSSQNVQLVQTCHGSGSSESRRTPHLRSERP